MRTSGMCIQHGGWWMLSLILGASCFVVGYFRLWQLKPYCRLIDPPAPRDFDVFYVVVQSESNPALLSATAER
jgi:hypothetical protein